MPRLRSLLGSAEVSETTISQHVLLQVDDAPTSKLLSMVDWNPYLECLCNAYTQWWKFGTLKDVVEPKRVESEPSTLPFEFGLMVQTVERDAQQRGKEQKVERLSVLEGLQKYASEHVLLVGRPGAGKSTALVRLLVATAQQARQNPHSQIPVLVELRSYKIYYKTSVLDLVQASLKRRKLRLNIETLEELLAEGRFLLLMDGINELPDDEARNHIKAFRLDYSDVPMVFTTRDLGVGGDLGIERMLEMQSLTEAEVEKFVREGMPGGSQQTLQQLRQRLRQLGQTPFVMWMLYFIVAKTGTVPSGAGSAFREFTQLYERRSKDDAPVSEESRRWWSRLLEHLGFEMMQAQKPTDFRLTISRREAEDILSKVLDSEKFDKPRDYALRWLEDLLKHHLIQVTSNDQIEFCHQLIQEYYAAEILLKGLTSPPRRTSPPAPLLQGEGSKSVPPFPGREGGLGGLGLSDDELKREYLNYLKWTEPLALMLELVEDEAQAVRVVRLALEVDLRLGARLVGAVKLKWQNQTVGLVAGLEIPQFLKIQLLEITKSEKAIEELVKALNDEDSSVRWRGADALGKIGSDAPIEELVKALNDEDSSVRWRGAYALGEIGSDVAIEELVKALNDEDSSVRWRGAYALGEIGSDAAIEELVKALNHEDSDVRSSAADALGKIGSDAAIEELVKALNHEDSDVRSSAADALGKIASPDLLPDLSLRLKTDRKTNLLYTISAIQNRCKFYNYTLTQPPSPSVSRKSKPKKSSKQPKSTSLMHILHLSDLHFGTLDQANLWSSQLAEDLRNELEIPQLDALILSGDIANYSTPDEYNAAEHFLNKLRQQFSLTPEQIIIVPGNHDINWKQAKKAYRLERREEYDGELREGCYIDRGDIIEIRDEQDYKQRFANFSHFYQVIKGEPYPPDYEQQGILHHLTEQNLLILGLNSAWQLDHHYKTRANIHPIALSNALDQINLNQKTYQNCLKIAVWHHPIHSTGEDRITDAAFLDRLAVAGFRLFLHGHVHEAKTSNYRYDMNKDGRNLDQICAGTFGAPTKELVTGTPWQYNLLKFEGDKLTVRTRCRRRENGTWEADSIWRQGKGKGSVDFYTIKL